VTTICKPTDIRIAPKTYWNILTILYSELRWRLSLILASWAVGLINFNRRYWLIRLVTEITINRAILQLMNFLLIKSYTLISDVSIISIKIMIEIKTKNFLLYIEEKA
jgi:hypothetical protein